MIIRAGTMSAVALTTLLLAAAPAAAQMMGGGAAVAGNGVGGREFEGGNNSAPAYDPAVEYRAGVAELQAGKFHEAERSFNHALAVDSNNSDTFYMLGLAKAGGGDWKGASRAYERSLKLDSHPINVRRDYAVALAKLNQADKAQAQYAILKAQADACGTSCPVAGDLKAALAAVEAALPPTAKAG